MLESASCYQIKQTYQYSRIQPDFPIAIPWNGCPTLPIEVGMSWIAAITPMPQQYGCHVVSHWLGFYYWLELFLYNNSCWIKRVIKNNWFFIGHSDAERRSAVICSLLMLARWDGYDLVSRLGVVLCRISTCIWANLAELLPCNMKPQAPWNPLEATARWSSTLAPNTNWLTR